MKEMLFSAMVDLAKELAAHGCAIDAVHILEICREAGAKSPMAVERLNEAATQVFRAAGARTPALSEDEQARKIAEMKARKDQLARHWRMEIKAMQLILDPLAHRILVPPDAADADARAERERLRNDWEQLRRERQKRQDDDIFFCYANEAHQIGNDLYKAGDYNGAVQVFADVLEDDPSRIEPVFNMGMAHYRLGLYQRALLDFTRAIEMNADCHDAYYVRGLTYEALNEYALAEADHERALEILPSYKSAQERLAQVRRKLREGADSSRASDRDSKREGAPIDYSMYRVKSEIRFSDVAGCPKALEELAKVVHFAKHPQLWRKHNLLPPTGILLVGLPGVGKTLLAQALAGELNAPFYNIRANDLLSVWYSESEKNIYGLFEYLARENPLSVVFLDEIDALATRRWEGGAGDGDRCHNRTVSALLSEMSGFAQRTKIIIMGATNLLRNIDAAFLRPGRFSRVIHIHRPSAEDLGRIFQIEIDKIHRGAKAHSFSREIDYRRLGEAAGKKSLVGDHIREIVRRTAEEALIDSMTFGDAAEGQTASTDDLLRHLEAFEVALLEDDGVTDNAA